MLKGKRILLGITGSIAAYKSIFLLRLLRKAGAEVRVILTPSARDFVPDLTLSTLSGQPVLWEMFDETSWSNHVMLGRWADLFLVAPASANTISKMAHGQCDNLLLAVYLSATCPVMFAPAMDEDMWLHPSTRKNIELLRSYNNIPLQVGKGELASGLSGEGRMAEPEEILQSVEDFFFGNNSLKGITAIVSAGPTHEPIDPVRFIGNHSSGKMGIALARELKSRGARVVLVLGPVANPPSPNGIETIHVSTASEMFEACNHWFPKADLTIMAAAVADYRVEEVQSQKVKKKKDHWNLELTPTVDILQTLGEQKKKGQVLVGFALETEKEEANALKKLEAKHADMIVLNSLREEGAGFGGDTNKVTIYNKNGEVIPFELKTKQEVAKDIVDTITRLYYA